MTCVLPAVFAQDLHIGMVKKLYGQHYNMELIFMEPEHLGHFGTARARVYIFLFHKELVVNTYSCQRMYSSISHAMKARVSTVPSDYFVADSTDMVLESSRVARMRKLDWKEKAPWNLLNVHTNEMLSFIFGLH